MLVVLSPAKKLNFTTLRKCLAPTTPQFRAQAEHIVTTTLSTQNATQLSKTLKVSTNLANLNTDRYTNFLTGTSAPTTHLNDVTACAVTAYSGRAWQGLDQQTLTDKELTYCNQTLRIVSGLYGLLRPSDLIQPYRLDMGTSLQVEEHKHLYAYWGDRLKNSLLAETANIIVNVASNEYWKACLEKELSTTKQVVTVAFREGQGTGARVIAVHAKLARGKFVRFMCQTEPTTIDDLKGFTGDIGYVFDSTLSHENLLVFTRTRSGGSGGNGGSGGSGRGKKRSARKIANKSAAASKTKTKAKSKKTKTTKKSRR